MTARKSESGKKPKVDRLDLNKETVHELTESEAAAAEGGAAVDRTRNRHQTPCLPTASERQCTLGRQCPSAQKNCPHA